MIALFHILGSVLTLITLGLLVTGGYLGALLLFRREPVEDADPPDPLTIAVASLLLTTAQAVAVALVLGALGLLRLELALALQTALVYGLYRGVRRRGGGGAGLATVASLILRRSWGRLRQYPALTLITVHAAGTELVRGLLRPPLSWDSLMYHMFLAATWLQQESFAIVAARHPTSFYQFMPGNGSLWLWWWMAPSHSELYTGMAFVPQWLLLGIATGAVARRLGARDHWPIASFLVLLLPTVVRFVAAQYVDLAMGALLVAGTLFAMRWLDEGRWADAVLLGIAGGLVAGTKVLGIPFAVALAVMTLLLARKNWGRRLPQLAVMALLALLLGGYFYARNLGYGGGPFGYECAKQDESQGEAGVSTFPAENSPVDILPQLLEDRMLVGAFLGVTRPTMAELGIGPVALVLVPIALVLPFLMRGRKRLLGWLVFGQVGAQLFVWMTLTYAANAHVFANVRYLIGAIGLLVAAALALGERHLTAGWLRGLALAILIQDLLMLNPRMPYQVRMLLAWVLVGAVVIAVAPRLRAWLVGHGRAVAAVGGLCLLLGVPPWASFRIRDRQRAFEQDYIVHLSTTRLFAAGWGWLDENAGTGTVAVSHAPENFFVYPAMGPYFERRAVYVNVNEADFTNPLLYADCKTRVDPSAEAWTANLRMQQVRWLHVARYPEFEFPVEDAWARARPDLFALRFDHPTNRVWEFLPASAPELSRDRRSP